jgi:hypothetical protein
MAKKEKVSPPPISSEDFSNNYDVGDIVEKDDPFYGYLLGSIYIKDISPGGYHFCWVRWVKVTYLSPEHYNCLRHHLKKRS